jgi:hypothetical protein
MVEWLAPLIKPLLELLGFTLPKVENKAKGLLQLLNSNQNVLVYHQHIEELCGTTNLIGLNKPVPLVHMYTKVLILDEPTANQRHTFSSLQTVENVDELLYSIPKKDGIEVIKATGNKRLMILGSPGSGKTTFLKHIALQASFGEFGDKLAVFITLKKWIDEKEISLLDYLIKQFEVCEFPDAKPTIQRYLENGNLIILFDGLDEIYTESEKAKDIFKEIDYFSSKYLNSKLIITCRTNELPHGFTRFTKVEIAKFGNEEINFFVENWFTLQEMPELVPLFFKEFEKAQNVKLKEMAGIPILLSLLCIVFKHERRFYQRQIEIYKKAVDILLREDELNKLKDYSPDRSEIYSNLHLSNRKDLFSRVAYHYSEKKQIFFEKDDVIKIVAISLQEILETTEYIDGLKILNGIETQHGILIERFKDIYSFSHRSFHEYFTASYFADKNRLKHLLTRKRVLWGWREVILNTARLLDNGDEFFDIFHNTINQIIGNEPKLIKILKTADEKTRLQSAESKISGFRFFYLYLMFIGDFEISSKYDFYLSRLFPTELSQIFNLFREINYLDNLNAPEEETFELKTFIDYDHSPSVEPKTESEAEFLSEIEYWINREKKISHARHISNIYHVRTENRDSSTDRTIKQIHQLDLNGAELIAKAIKILVESDIEISWECQLFMTKLLIKNFYNKIKWRNAATNISQKLNIFFTIIVGNCNNVSDKVLKTQLQKLVGIKENLSVPEYRKIIKVIDKSLLSYSFIIKTNLNNAQRKKLLDYFDAYRLLLESLDLAIVSDRKLIEDKILLPQK